MRQKNDSQGAARSLWGLPQNAPTLSLLYHTLVKMSILFSKLGDKVGDSALFYGMIVTNNK